MTAGRNRGCGNRALSIELIDAAEKSTRSVELVIHTVVCLTLAKWETVSGQFGGYLRDQLTNAALAAWFGSFEEPPYINQKGHAISKPIRCDPYATLQDF
jgi:hypothetical protein